jgi:hypothetical protein
MEEIYVQPAQQPRQGDLVRQQGGGAEAALFRRAISRDLRRAALLG